MPTRRVRSASTSTSARTTAPRSRRIRWSRRITMIEGSSIAPEIGRTRCVRSRRGQAARPGLPRQQPHPRPRARRARGLRAADDRSAATASSSTPSSRTCRRNCTGDRPWGPGDNPKTAVHEYLGRPSGVRDRPAHRPQAAGDGRARRLPPSYGLAWQRAEQKIHCCNSHSRPRRYAPVCHQECAVTGLSGLHGSRVGQRQCGQYTRCRRLDSR